MHACTSSELIAGRSLERAAARAARRRAAVSAPLPRGARARPARLVRSPAAAAAVRAMLALVPALPRPAKATGSASVVGAAGIDAESLGRREPDDAELRAANDGRRVFAANGQRRARIGLLTGCVQTVLDPAIKRRRSASHARGLRASRRSPAAAARSCITSAASATRASSAAGCSIESAERLGGGLDALVANASGCGTHSKDYGSCSQRSALARAGGGRDCARTRDVTELLAEIGLPPAAEPPRVTSHTTRRARCNMARKSTSRRARCCGGPGSSCARSTEGHLCCGSAGTYNILQPEIAARLRERKPANVARTGADIVATGNIGCIAQLAAGTGLAVAHTVELLDWATGGPAPPAWLARRER